ncbi:major facilitator superfamily domain-containing protein [Calycina marina]|uniref:Major facilitator superfamily domain-containing protein n=1 Tax=Calycina marina TaxID=1763456 RepID=A0A9P7Z8J1_9HELO|nr:major facilitator superfamily domain-containing protein [Calycina marina]
MAQLAKKFKWLYRELGIASVWETGKDAWLIIISRWCRMLAYGANSLILALFFSELKFSDFYIGLFMTLTLVGDVLLSLLLTLVADRVGRRRVMFLGSVLMMFSGAMFSVFENYWVLLLGAVIGILSATGGDIGPFRAIEESTLSQLTTPKTRSDVLSWYVTTASIGSALGTEFCGRMVDWISTRDGWSIIDAYHKMFYVYVAGGLINIICTISLSEKCEAQKQVVETEALEMLLDENGARREDDDGLIPNPKPRLHLFGEISSETRWIMYRLWFLLSVDSLADGMVGHSLTNYYFDKKFHMAKSTLGDVVSISYILSSVSTIFAAPLAHHIGLVNTMVFTHVPSSAAVLLFPFPNKVVLTVILFFIRTGLNNMDQAPRAAFIAAVVSPEERTAVMGITNMLRTLASTTGPSVTGILAVTNRFWVAYVAAGCLRLAYDLGLWAMFINMKLHKHESKKAKHANQRRDEESTEFSREASF